MGEKLKQAHKRAVETTRDVLPPVVKPVRARVLIMNDKGLFLAVCRAPDKSYAHTWGIPTGKLNEDEKKAKEAAKREAMEESNQKIKGLTLIQKFEGRTRISNDFVALADGKRPVKLDAEHTDFKWTKLDEWPQPIHPGLKKLIQSKRDDIVKFAKKHKIKLPTPKPTKPKEKQQPQPTL